MLYTSKPVDAIQYTGHNYDEVAKWLGDKVMPFNEATGNIDMTVRIFDKRKIPHDWVLYSTTLIPGNWLIKAVNEPVSIMSESQFNNEYQEYE